ncbi:putative membrane protein [Burkholderia cepacia]|nr:putative membrane protein [Burkholderia cepacia]
MALFSASRKATVAVSGVFGETCVFIVILLCLVEWLAT